MTDAEREKLPAWLGGARLAVGLAQGLALYGLHEAKELSVWPATQPEVFGALALIVTFVPLILIGGLGALPRVTLGAWALAAAVLLGWMGWHAIARDMESYTRPWPADAYLAAAALVFIAHHLIAAGDEARRWIAPYERYFDLGWRHGAQLVLSVAFVCAFWGLLYLGAALFTVIDVEWLRETIQEPWFYCPATTLALASAIHLTDLRAGLVRGFRLLGLTLLAWLGPVLTLIAAAFLITLPFTGLQPLWNTQSASAILLSAAASLIILINAAYQDGAASAAHAAVLRWSARLAALLLAPLMALSIVAISMRVSQYGLTGDRVLAIVALAVATVYALFYLAASFWRPWMQLVERGNIVSAFVVIAAILAVYTPIADPARLGVGDQVARLQRGVIAPDKFDYVYLAFDTGRYGREALDRLAEGDNAIIADRARAVRQYENRWEAAQEQNPEAPEWMREDVRAEVENELVVVPAGARLPEGFLAAGTTSGVMYRCREMRCEATPIDLTGDGAPEVLVSWNDRISIFGADADGDWVLLGAGTAQCWDRRQGLAGRRIETAEPTLPDILIDGARVQIRRDFRDEPCRVAPIDAAPAER
jgi:hypothetical protein